MKALDSPEYRIPLQDGNYALNMSKWSRENVPKSPPKFKVGDEVVYTVKTEILRVYADCDGTTLYQIDENGYGISEISLSEVNND
jgi:hypothetical protein